MRRPAPTNSEDPAYRAALEAAVLPVPARSSGVLWRDAELIAREEGAAEIGARHLRQALDLQYAIAAAIDHDPEWSRERLLAHGPRKAAHRAERAGS
jgi:hypothetical protein